jgi:peptidoglycan/xylan/chitin deacetylase (PgdA/CDA1 family)
MADRPLERAAVLMFHGLTHGETNIDVPVRERKYWVNADRFSRQLNAIRDSGAAIVPLYSFWSRPAETPAAGAAVITFDDGAISDYEIAFPRLLEANATASFFLNTGTVGRPGYVSWDQVREMRKYGMTFYSHSHDHVYLTKLSLSALAFQMQQSREMLEEKLGVPAEFLSLPFGDGNGVVIREALRAGFAAVCTSRCVRAQPGQTTIDRVAVYAGCGVRTIRRMVGGDPWFYAGRAAKAALIHIPKRIILTKAHAN